MINDQYKEIAQKAMKFALNNGCSDVRIRINSGVNNSLEYRDNQLDRLQQASENSFSIELFVDKRYGSYSTNRLNEKELEKFILNGIAATRFLAEDPYRKLPDPSRYFKNNGNSLNVFDSGYNKIGIEEKIEISKAAVNEVFGTDSRITSVSSDFSDNCNSSYMLASNGFEGLSESTYYSLSASTALKDAGDARPSSGWYEGALFWKDLPKTGIGKKALKRTIDKLGQQPIASGKYSMLVDKYQITRLLSPMIYAMYGGSLQQKNSFLLDKLGEKIVSDKFVLIDDPHIPSAMGARWFDGEGIATQKRTVIDKGVLNCYYIDTYNSEKMGVSPTIQSPSVLVCELGSKNFDQIMGELKSGIWVTGFNGGNSNSTTGDFSFGIEGFLVENGAISKPVNEMNITGNLLELWNSIIEIGNDPRLSSSWRIPTVLFDGVNFSGR